MKHLIATLSIAIALTFGPSSILAGEVEKEPLNLEEITELAVEEQVDQAQLTDTEGGMVGGAGLLIVGAIILAIAVAN
tara:strand:- start:4949 stop:5182 length:234 start_codon:yes stop_codon:yes gene_type:complete